MSLLESARNSEFKKLINGDLSIEGAIIIWTNFEGRPTKFNPAGGKRTFVLVLTDTVAEELRNEGWNIKTREPREEGEDPLFFTEIVINMDSKFPPKVVLYSEFNGKKSANKLTSETIRQLDSINIANVDVIIHPYEHNFSSVANVKGYANALYITQAPDSNFGGKYAEYEMGGVDSDDDIPF